MASFGGSPRRASAASPARCIYALSLSLSPCSPCSPCFADRDFFCLLWPSDKDTRANMRLHATLRSLLCAALLLLCCTSAPLASAEHRCGFTEVMKRARHNPPFVVHEVPQASQGARQAHTAATPDEWAPIRILVSMEDIENKSRHCTTVGQVRPTFYGVNTLCYGNHILTTESKRILLDRVIPAAVKLHRDRLLVQPAALLIPVPFFGSSSLCHYFTIPAAHHNPGVSGYDTILYAAAGPSLEKKVVAWAAACAKLFNGRPVIGAMNFAPDLISPSSMVVRTAAHEMGHALGFSYSSFESHGMVTVKTGLRGKKNTYLLNSTKVVEKARAHYNCSTAPGMELEDEGGGGTALSHWERRNAKDELMAGVTSFGYYTALTMAAFEDLTFYRANWGMEEPMTWGWNSGCDLLTKKCVEKGVAKYPHMFCTEKKTAVFHCTSDRLALGSCNLVTYSKALPPQYQYFPGTRISGSSLQLTDYCPVFFQSYGHECRNGDPELVPSSRFGRDSLCLKGDSLVVGGKFVGDVCAEVRCEGRRVLVRYRGDDRWQQCPEGDFLTPTKTFESGRIVCPKYDEVCTIAFDGSSRVTNGNGGTDGGNGGGNGGTDGGNDGGNGGGNGGTDGGSGGGNGGTDGGNGGGNGGTDGGSGVGKSSYNSTVHGGGINANGALDELSGPWNSSIPVNGNGKTPAKDGSPMAVFSAPLVLLIAAVSTVAVP